MRYMSRPKKTHSKISDTTFDRKFDRGGWLDAQQGHQQMPSLITARIDHVTGWVELKFSFSRTTIDALKLLPGSRWNPQSRSWSTVQSDNWRLAWQ